MSALRGMRNDRAPMGDAGSAAFAEREVSKPLPLAARQARSEAGKRGIVKGGEGWKFRIPLPPLTPSGSVITIHGGKRYLFISSAGASSNLVSLTLLDNVQHEKNE